MLDLRFSRFTGRPVYGVDELDGAGNVVQSLGCLIQVPTAQAEGGFEWAADYDLRKVLDAAASEQAIPTLEPHPIFRRVEQKVREILCGGKEQEQEQAPDLQEKISELETLIYDTEQKLKSDLESTHDSIMSKLQGEITEIRNRIQDMGHQIADLQRGH